MEFHLPQILAFVAAIGREEAAQALLALTIARGAQADKAGFNRLYDTLEHGG